MRIIPLRPEHLAAVAGIQHLSPEVACWDPADYLAHHAWVAEAGHHIAGFLVARSVGASEVELLNLAVHPQWRRQGVATALLAAMTQHLPADIFLEVRAANEGARLLYARAGFTEVGRRPGYYRDPPDEAIVMRLRK